MIFQNEVSFVSLRDVERVLKVFVWFMKQDTLMEAIEEAVRREEERAHALHAVHAIEDSENEEEEEQEDLPVDPMTRALILALGVCYHSCLEMETREDYRTEIAQSFHGHYRLPMGEQTIEAEITRYVYMECI